VGAAPLQLYSTNTALAFGIATKYYAHIHWVWCSPFFRAPSSALAKAPASAIPGEIYDDLYKGVSSHDTHCSWIAQNRLGLARGAQAKLAAGVITPDEHADIVHIATTAPVADFAPLLYVIPYSLVSSRLKKVPIKDRAHPLSDEFIIEDLNESEFDALVLR
jgi:hypothetical protein